MEPFKNLYNSKSIGQMGRLLEDRDSKFSRRNFLKEALLDIDRLEMKQRVEQIAKALDENLSGGYRKKLATLLKTVKSKRNPKGLEGFILWPYTYFVETRGLNDFQISMDALYKMTKVYTSEFGVRPFLEMYPEKVYAQFLEWAEDPDPHIRRWVSEGTRPNLPWGMGISHIQKNVHKNMKLLEVLRDDPSLYVRKSIANHLNDIGWFDEKRVLKILARWERNRVVHIEMLKRQALRNLIKRGHPEALKLMGFDPGASCKIHGLKTSRKSVREGESVDLEAGLTNTGKTTQKYAVDYVIHFQKANGSTSAKVFKWKAVSLEPKETLGLCKKVSFKKVTTRSHVSGAHRIAVQVNGRVLGATSVELICGAKGS